MNPHLRAFANTMAPFSLLLATVIVADTPSTVAMLTPLAVEAPESPVAPNSTPACTSPAPVHTSGSFHCYTPAQIAAAYGVDKLHQAGLMGQGQTIVLVDSYGDPTAAQDLQFFHDTFFPSLPNPNFTQWTPLGNPAANYTCTKSNGISGPCSAANWSVEATLDVQWAYAMAPLAHIVLLATPPAETLGVQGLPNLFKAIQMAIDAYPAGTVFSQSFGLAEQTFGGAALTQMQAFDDTYQNGTDKGDTFLASSGDQGNGGAAKQHKESTTLSTTAVGFPAISPLVTAELAVRPGLGQRRHAFDPRPFVERGRQRRCADLHDAISGGAPPGLARRGRHECSEPADGGDRCARQPGARDRG